MTSDCNKRRQNSNGALKVGGGGSGEHAELACATLSTSKSALSNTTEAPLLPAWSLLPLRAPVFWRMFVWMRRERKTLCVATKKIPKTKINPLERFARFPCRCFRSGADPVAIPPRVLSGRPSFSTCGKVVKTGHNKSCVFFFSYIFFRRCTCQSEA